MHRRLIQVPKGDVATEDRPPAPGLEQVTGQGRGFRIHHAFDAGQDSIDRIPGFDDAQRHLDFQQAASRGVGDAFVGGAGKVRGEIEVKFDRSTEVIRGFSSDRGSVDGLVVELATSHIATNVMSKREGDPRGFAPVGSIIETFNQIPGDRPCFKQVPERVVRVGEVRLQHRLHVGVRTSH